MKTSVSHLDILDYVPNGSFILGKDLSVLFWNVFLEDWTGIGRERIVGENIAEFFPELVKTKYLRRLNDIFEGGPPAVFSSQLHPHLIPSRLPDGRPRIQHTTVMPYPCEEGEGFYALFAVQDVTDLSDAIRKQRTEHRKLMAEMEQRLRLEEKIQHAQRLESLTRLAGGVAHDFNNILMGVLGYTGLILCENSLPPKILKYAGLVEQSAQKAATLSHQMLAYTGNGLLSKESVNLTSLAESMKPLLTSSTPRKAKLMYDLDSRVPAVKADPAKLKQILMNFVTNAAEALNDGSGCITISTGAEYCDRDAFSEAFFDYDPVPGIYSYIEVSDTGCGMDSETSKKIFDPFFTTKFPGRGLGLAASLGIIRGHSGAVVVKSEPSKGTTIRALFPALEEKPGQRKPAETRRPELDFPFGKTVLIVDDEQIVRFASESLLRQLGWNTVSADSGEKGIEIFKEMADRIDAAIVDLTMPGMSGEEVFHEMRKIKRDTRVILSSAYSAEGVVEELSRDGLAGFLRKPYSLAALEAELIKIAPERIEREHP